MISKRLFSLILLLLSFTLSAQNDSYDALTETQKTNSIKISEEKIGSSITYDSGMNYDGILYWHVITEDKKEFYFSSDTSFKEVKHEEGNYSSLMEFVIEAVGF